MRTFWKGYGAALVAVLVGVLARMLNAPVAWQLAGELFGFLAFVPDEQLDQQLVVKLLAAAAVAMTAGLSALLCFWLVDTLLRAPTSQMHNLSLGILLGPLVTHLGAWPGLAIRTRNPAGRTAPHRLPGTVPAQWFLEIVARLLPSRYREDFLGDLEEVHALHVQESGPKWAWVRLVGQALLSFCSILAGVLARFLTGESDSRRAD